MSAFLLTPSFRTTKFVSKNSRCEQVGNTARKFDINSVGNDIGRIEGLENGKKQDIDRDQCPKKTLQVLGGRTQPTNLAEGNIQIEIERLTEEPERIPFAERDGDLINLTGADWTSFGLPGELRRLRMTLHVA